MPNKTVTVRIGVTGAAKAESDLNRVGAAGKKAGADLSGGMNVATAAAAKTSSTTRTLGGDSDAAAPKLTRLESAFRKQGVTVGEYGDALGRAGGGLQKTGLIMTGVLGAAGAASVAWEDQFTGVRKTVDLTGDAMNDLEGDLRGMARTMPTTHKDIAAVAEAAGQLGVESSSIADFTKTMVMLGDTTNLSADEAATSIAQLMSVMGTAPDKVSNLGSVIVDLGNKGASTERDIVQMGQRISGVGNQIGLSEDQVLAFGSAIASTGVNVEAGGTAMSKTFLRIDDAVRAGGTQLEALAATSGMSADQFRQAWGKDAARATDAFVEGLGAIQAKGGSVSATLAEIGVKGQYERDVMTRLAGATKAAGAEHGLLTQNIDNAAAAMAANTALTAEAEKRYETSASKIKVAWNNIVDAGISAGGSLLPVVSEIAGDLATVAQGFGSLPGPVQEVVVKFAAFAAVLLLVGGSSLKMISSLMAIGSTMKTLVGGTAALRAAYAGLSAEWSAGGGKLIGVAAALAAVQIASSQLTAQMDKNSAGVDGYTTALGEAAMGGDQLDASFKKWGSSAALAGLGIKDTTSAFENLKGVQNPVAKGFDKVAKGLSIIPGLNLPSTYGTITAEFEKLDDALTKMSPEDAAKAFGVLSADAQKAGWSVEDLASVFPKYTESLAKGSRANVEATNRMREQTAAFAQARGVLEQLAAGQQRSAEQSQKLAGELFTEGNAYQNAISGRLGYKQAVSDTTKAIEVNSAKVAANGGKLSENTQAGRDNMNALLGLASAGKGYVQSLVAQGASAKEASAATSRVRTQFLAAADAAGIGGKEAKKMADELGLVPSNVSVKIEAFGLAMQQQQVQQFVEALNKLPAEQATRIQAIYEDKGAKAAIAELDKIQGKKSTTKIETRSNTKEKVAQSNKEMSKAKSKTTKVTTNTDAKSKVASANKEVSKAKGKSVKITTNTDAKNKVAQSNKEVGKAKGKNTKITVTNNTKEKVSSSNKEISKTKGKSVKIDVNTNARSVASSAQGAINSVHGKTVTITTVHKSVGKKAFGGPVERLAGGGEITSGVSTPRADDVPTLLSWKEWVIQRPSAEKYGDARMAAVNAGTARILMPGESPQGLAYGGMVGRPMSVQKLATGGRVDPAIWAMQTAIANPLAVVAQYAAAAAAAARALAAAQKLVVGPQKKMEAAQKAYTAAVDKRDKLKVRIANLQKAANATKGVTKADRDLKKARAQLAKQNTVVTATSKKKKAATEAYNKVADVAKKKAEELAEKNKELADQQKAIADEARQASEGFRNMYRSGSTDAADWIDMMKTGATDLGAFTAKVIDLRNRGLNETLVQQIIGMGAVAGGELADQIVLGGKTLVDQLNAANDALQKAADNLGYQQATGTGRYDSGGWLMPGQKGVNLSGKPEPVFTDAQWDTLSRYVAAPLSTGSRSVAGQASADYAVIADAVRAALEGMALSGVVDASSVDGRISVVMERAGRTYNRRG